VPRPGARRASRVDHVPTDGQMVGEPVHGESHAVEEHVTRVDRPPGSLCIHQIRRDDLDVEAAEALLEPLPTARDDPDVDLPPEQFAGQVEARRTRRTQDARLRDLHPTIMPDTPSCRKIRRLSEFSIFDLVEGRVWKGRKESNPPIRGGRQLAAAFNPRGPGRDCLHGLRP
jgi:hypothetical protein